MPNSNHSCLIVRDFLYWHVSLGCEHVENRHDLSISYYVGVAAINSDSVRKLAFTNRHLKRVFYQ